MEFPDNAETEFRMQVRTFAARHAAQHAGPPPTLGDRAAVQSWTTALDRQGWLVPHWPADAGGRSWSALRHYVLREELCAPERPEVDTIGLQLVGPLLARFGSVEQKQRYLPRIRGAADLWCQGFSEPDCGSDLTRIRTTARAAPGGYVVDGHKVWITNAHLADRMMVLVRVRDDRTTQPGHTLLLLDMHSPGVTVRPITTIDSRHTINEVTLSQVAVPQADLVGEEGHAWTYAAWCLVKERIMAAQIPRLGYDLERLGRLNASRGGRDPRWDCEAFVTLQWLPARMEFLACRFLMLRLLELPEADESAGALAAVLKVAGTELAQKVIELTMELLGEAGLVSSRQDSAFPGICAAQILEVQREFLFSRARSIAAGTSEIQRNIVAALTLF